MFLHLGADISIYAGEVIGIFDYGLIESDSFREFIELAQWNDKIYKLDGEPKSVVLTANRIYYVSVSRATLAKRWDRYTRPIYQNM